MKTEARFQYIRKAGKKQTKYSTDFRQAGASNFLWVRVLGVHTLECLETSTVSSGLLNIVRATKIKFSMYRQV